MTDKSILDFTQQHEFFAQELLFLVQMIEKSLLWSFLGMPIGSLRVIEMFSLQKP